MNPPLPKDPELIRRLLDHMNTSVLLFDEQLRLVYINQSGEVLFGVSARNLLGQGVGELILCESKDVHGQLEQVRSNNSPHTEYAIRIELANIKQIRADCTVTPITATGEILMELQPQDRHLRISHDEQMAEQHASTHELIRGVAHEVKNPLGGLRGAAQLLDMELNDEGQREYTQLMLKEIDRLRELVDRMLGPNRAPKLAETNIHEVLERVRSVLISDAGDRVRFVRDYDPSLPLIQADLDQLIQAFINLAGNAVQVLGEGGVIILRTRIDHHLSLKSHGRELFVRVDVEDNGPGIPEDMQERIFLPMVTGRAEGQGLGLAIARSYIHHHNGLIELNSQPGRTIFSVFLPLEVAGNE